VDDDDLLNVCDMKYWLDVIILLLYEIDEVQMVRIDELAVLFD